MYKIIVNDITSYRSSHGQKLQNGQQAADRRRRLMTWIKYNTYSCTVLVPEVFISCMLSARLLFRQSARRHSLILISPHVLACTNTRTYAVLAAPAHLCGFHQMFHLFISLPVFTFPASMGNDRWTEGGESRRAGEKERRRVGRVEICPRKRTNNVFVLSFLNLKWI